MQQYFHLLKWIHKSYNELLFLAKSLLIPSYISKKPESGRWLSQIQNSDYCKEQTNDRYESSDGSKKVSILLYSV